MTESPLLRDVFPDLVAELSALLAAQGERESAITVLDVRLVRECGCASDPCQSLWTADHPAGQPFGAGYRCVPLLTDSGMLNLDVVDGRIVYIEVLDRAPLRRRDARP
ncbi:hypothetical protein OG455_33115 [Kitasatospora sp. NBC_01287]|uniref:hypothetical protein n=1 Tax=Kitasatospora sp. NBC_01287 TaxID=2903573 RepID=UPI00225B5348|nr:hypothetical protein [Kitasatospora sp. NBC_01287]MCX4750298.1 hypothetical protein [Kitasatospora sp. NBC_01287]